MEYEATIYDKIHKRIARWLSERGIEEFVVKPEGDAVKVYVNGEEAGVVRVKVAKEKGKTDLRVYGSIADEVNRKALELANELAKRLIEITNDKIEEDKEVGKLIEERRAEPYQIRALLATDGGYDSEQEIIYAATTSVVQAAWYRWLGMKISRRNYACLTKRGLKPVLNAWLPKEEGGAEVVEMIKNDLENAVRALEDNKRRMDLLLKALALLGRIEISVGGVDKEAEEGRRKIAEVKRAIMDRIEYFAKLRLGEDGKVCLANCRFGEPTLTYKHEVYARVVAPLLHYIAEDAPVEEAMKFLAHTIFYDGHVDRYRVLLVIGHFSARKERKKLPLDIYDKVALYLILAAKYNVEVRGMYIGEDATMIYFNKEHASWIFTTAWPDFSALWSSGKRLDLHIDHAIKKLEAVRRYSKRFKIEHELMEEGGMPKLVVYFRDEDGRELAHIDVKWNGRNLYATFIGSKEKAKRLISILNVLGVDAEARKYDEKWYVELTSNLTTIQHPKWLEAMKALVKALHRYGVIDDKRRDELLKKIATTGPDVVEVAGIKLNVTIRTNNSSKLVILYRSKSPEAFDYAVKALKDAGFEEGLHFTARRPEGGRRGYVYLRIPASLWRLEELRRQGVEWAGKAIDRLEEIARERGSLDILEQYLKLAREAETVDPRTIVVEDKERGIRAVIRDLRLEWEDGRPKITVEYEINGRDGFFYLTWRAKKVRASVRLNDERAFVLAALMDDESLKRGRGEKVLTAKYLFVLVRYKGIGWDLLRWYAQHFLFLTLYLPP